jgi:DNA-binding FadR family transcriptional regulator
MDIVGDIMSGGLRTGDRLPLEAAMLDQYTVSRASLREALRLLEVQGLIRLKPGPGGGPVVGSVDARNLGRTLALYFHLAGVTYLELLDAQVVLEPLVASLAAEHPDHAVAMEPFLDAPDLADLDGDAAYRRYTSDFHWAVYRLAANSVVVLISQAVTHIVADQVVATMDPIGLRSAILDEHAELARVIAEGDSARAAALMGDHFAVQRDHYRVHHPNRLGDLVEWR